jgi:hypothetical protein
VGTYVRYRFTANTVNVWGDVREATDFVLLLEMQRAAIFYGFEFVFTVTPGTYGWAEFHFKAWT